MSPRTAELDKFFPLPSQAPSNKAPLRLAGFRCCVRLLSCRRRRTARRCRGERASSCSRRAWWPWSYLCGVRGGRRTGRWLRGWMRRTLWTLAGGCGYALWWRHTTCIHRQGGLRASRCADRGRGDRRLSMCELGLGQRPLHACYARVHRVREVVGLAGGSLGGVSGLWIV